MEPIDKCENGEECAPLSDEEHMAAQLDMFKKTEEKDLARMEKFGSYHVRARISNHSKRLADPVNDYTSDDFALCSTFPTVFPLGIAYYLKSGHKKIFSIVSVRNIYF
jgi:hypothetical protein